MDDDLDWDELMLFVRDGRVVPVVGSQLLRVDVDGHLTTIESVLARDLARELGLDVPATGELRLSEIAFRHLQQARGSTRRLYPKIKMALERRRFAIPPALRQLAAIREFPLILTTSFAPLLAVALDEVRSEGRRETEVLAFTPYAQPGDLRSSALGFGSHVYHLFGIASAMPEYVITEEDMIEFMHGLQSDRRPQNLFDYLRGRNLLFLGCGYTNWLARFFIRTLRNERFASGNPQKSEVIVDEVMGGDHELAVFLRHYDSQVFRALDATAFIDQLHQRWTQGTRAAPSMPAHVRQMPSDAVFVSYAREDLEQARRVVAALEGAGIDVWFDEQRLTGGADWDRTIQECIRRCSLFVPMISRHTESVAESYFHYEWKLAVQRAQRMARTRPFIVPLGVDDTPAEAPNVPDEFRQLQWVRLAAPDGLDAATRTVRDRVRQLRAPQYTSP